MRITTTHSCLFTAEVSTDTLTCITQVAALPQAQLLYQLLLCQTLLLLLLLHPAPVQQLQQVRQPLRP
jgi:hypothetical protein